MKEDNKDGKTGLGAHIPLIYHFAMLQDKQRMEGFREAISLAVTPNSKVLELGGGTGVLSSFAARSASKVYCVERIPENAAAARTLLDLNENGQKVEVVCADAFEYLPPEPVDVVICEMLHVGMLREKQIEVIESFKKRYRAKFGAQLPQFIPEAFIQGVQPISYDFNFSGYHAPVPLFHNPGAQIDGCEELADPGVYQIARYAQDLPMDIKWSGDFNIRKDGNFNALRMILKNILTIVPEENRTVDWHNQYLILPLAQPKQVAANDQIQISLSYRVGAEISDFIQSLQIRHTKAQRPAHVPLREQIEKIEIKPAETVIPTAEKGTVPLFQDS